MADAPIPERIGRYHVLSRLGEGAMGVVYRARDEGLEREVAIKVMRVESADVEARARFLREARAAARLQHPNIITVYELGEHGGAPFMAMELLDGVDLQRAIEGGLRPDPRVTLPIVLQLLAGLGHAHENGIVHRDVKPSNLFLPRGRPAKIMDFGVARLGGGTTATGLIVGTPNYMSPEQVRALPLDGRSDLFSAGLILYELVTGEKAYRGDSVVSLLYKIAHEEPDLSLLPRGPQWEGVRGVLAGALAREPDERYATAAAMAADVARALTDLGGSTDGAAASDQGLMRRTTARPAPSRTRGATAREPAAEAGRREEPPAAVETFRPAAEPAPAPGPPRALLLAALAAVAVLALAALGLLYALLTPHAPTRATATLPSSTVPSSAVGAVPTAVAPARPPLVPKAAARPPATASTPGGVPPRATLSATVPQAPAEPGAEPEAGGPEASTGNARLDRANDLYEKGRYAAALSEAKAVLRREPGNVEAKQLAEEIEADMVVETRLKQARESLRKGDREAALAQVRAGLAVKSTDGRLLALFRELTQ